MGFKRNFFQSPKYYFIVVVYYLLILMRGSQLCCFVSVLMSSIKTTVLAAFLCPSCSDLLFTNYTNKHQSSLSLYFIDEEIGVFM